VDGLPTFDLVVATVGRTTELAALLDSLGRQSHRGFRVLVVDQNRDDRLAALVDGRPFEIVRVSSERGLSRARNAVLGELRADVVAFPDDDCVYPDDLLERVGRRLGSVDGLTGRAVDEHGVSDPNWDSEPGPVTRSNVWHRAISFAIFLRLEVVKRVGPFDERLGLGAGTPWSSGEEIDYLVRAVDADAGIEYDPALTVVHPARSLRPDELRALRYRDGASVGYLLRKHRYPPRAVARTLIRPLGGAAFALARADVGRARTYAATLRGRVAGLTRG
jgi:glycosyltransferase involved in cell wall biosynthesis